MTKLWALMEAFLDAEGLEGADCRVQFNLNIFIIKEAQMREDARFLSYKQSANQLNYVISAFYDATPQVRGESAIILSTSVGEADTLGLAHEIAHYWFDRACIGRSKQEDSELFARKFEQYYRDQR